MNLNDAVLQKKAIQFANTIDIKEHKKSKYRVTILVVCNASGTEKIIPIFIGKSKNPRAFRKIKKLDFAKINIQYEYNKTAWMQVSIWNKWLLDLNHKMANQNR